MRILHVITSLRTGGAEKLMADLLPNFREEGQDVDLFTFDGTITQFRRRLEESGIRVFDNGIGKSPYHPSHLVKLRALAKNYDIIHSHNTACQIFSAISRRNDHQILITTEHNTSNRRRTWRWFRPIDRWMYSQYDHVICISQKTEDNLRHHIGKTSVPISTIPNGIEVKFYANATTSNELERLAPNSKKLIMVAAFRWEKDQDTLIHALSTLPHNFHLFLVGEGKRRQELQNLAKLYHVDDKVHFMGIREDVAELLHAADYVVHSSHVEGFGLAVVEAMASGTPVIASDVEGLNDIVKGYGILFEHQNSSQLAQIIINLDNNPEKAHKIAEACQRRAAHFDISRMAEQYLSLYKSFSKT